MTQTTDIQMIRQALTTAYGVEFNRKMNSRGNISEMDALSNYSNLEALYRNALEAVTRMEKLQ